MAVMGGGLRASGKLLEQPPNPKAESVSHFPTSCPSGVMVMRNSDKMISVSRRRASLLHAINGGFAQDVIEKRAEALRNAVLTAIKKERVRSKNYAVTESNAYSLSRSKVCSTLDNKWRQKSTDQIIELSRAWPDRPTFKDIEVAR